MLKQNGLFAAFLVLLTLLAVGIWDFFQGNTSRGGAIIVGSAIGLTWAFRIYIRPPSRSDRDEFKPGEVSCPACESLQTDREVEYLSDGTEAYHWRCFNCDHTWD